MAAVTPLARSLTSRVTRLVTAGEFSAVHTADQVIVLQTTPSARAARKAASCLSQVAALHLTIADGDVSAQLHGVDHRMPVERPCSLRAALALAEAGVTTYVTTDGSVGEGAKPSGAAVR